MSCAGTSLLSRPWIDSLPRYAPMTGSLPHDARKRPQAWCLTTRKDVAALPGYARKTLPHAMRSHKPSRDRLAVAIALTVIRDQVPVVHDVRPQPRQRLDQSREPRIGLPEGLERGFQSVNLAQGFVD